MNADLRKHCMNGPAAIETTVTGLGYELVEIERAAQGLLRVTIDRLPGRAYATGPGDHVLVEDCELVTRQLQHVLEVEGVDYHRLEVSSPGLDRLLRSEAHLARFAGELVRITLKQPFQGRKNYEGRLQAAVPDAGVAEAGVAEAGADAAVAPAAGWELHFHDGKADQVLGFTLVEVREARLVPVIDFKGRKARGTPPPAPVQEHGGHEE